MSSFIIWWLVHSWEVYISSSIKLCKEESFYLIWWPWINSSYLLVDFDTANSSMLSFIFNHHILSSWNTCWPSFASDITKKEDLNFSSSVGLLPNYIANQCCELLFWIIDYLKINLEANFSLNRMKLLDFDFECWLFRPEVFCCFEYYLNLRFYFYVGIIKN